MGKQLHAVVQCAFSGCAHTLSFISLLASALLVGVEEGSAQAHKEETKQHSKNGFSFIAAPLGYDCILANTSRQKQEDSSAQLLCKIPQRLEGFPFYVAFSIGYAFISSPLFMASPSPGPMQLILVLPCIPQATSCSAFAAEHQ